jgi:hypothetical protein
MRGLLALLIFLSPLEAFAGWAVGDVLGTGSSTTAGTTVAVTTSATLESGNFAACFIASDEAGTGTTDGTGNAQFTSVADSAGNTWTEAYEWCSMRTAAAADGTCLAVYTTQATSQLASSGTITATVASVDSKVMGCREFTVAGGSTISEAAGENGLANDGADPGSMTIATGVAQEHLFLRAIACETNAAGYTADSDYLTVGIGAAANTGTALTSQSTRSEYRIASEATSAASDPTYTPGVDCASAMVAFDEVAGGGGGSERIFVINAGQ